MNQPSSGGMNYLHTTIQRSQNILKCIAVQTNEADSCNLLLIFRNYAQLLSVENEHQTVAVSTITTYPLGSPIAWCCMVGEHIAAITNDAHLMMLESNPPFKRVSLHKLADKLSPSTIPIAHCAASSSGEFLVTCGFSEYGIVAQFDSDDNPTLQKIDMPQLFVYRVVPTTDPNIFAFLVSNYSGRKFVIFFDMMEFKEVRRIEVENDVYSIGAIFDDEGYGKLVIFSETKIEIEDVIIQPTTCKVNSWFVTPTGELIVQLINGDMLAIDPSKQNSTPKGNLPLISSFCCLSNNLLLCVTELGDSFFLPMNFSRSITSSSISFDLLPRTSIPLTPRITDASFNDHCLILASGGGETCYQVSSLVNSMPFVYLPEPEATDNFKKINIVDPISFFCIPNKCLFASDHALSYVLKGDVKIMSSKTICAGPFGNYYFQIHQNGIYRIDDGKGWNSPPNLPIVQAAIGEKFIVASFTDNKVKLFNNDLIVVVEKEIPHVQTFTFCQDFIAIAVDPVSGGNSTVTLYSFDLVPIDAVVQLPSQAYCIAYQPSTNELFVSTKNGSVMKWTIDSIEFSRSGSTIYVGTAPPYLFLFNEGVLFVSDKTYIYYLGKLLSTAIDKPKSICRGDLETELFVLQKDNSVMKVSISDLEKDYTTFNILAQEMPRKLTCMNKNIYAITRQNNTLENSFKSSLIFIKGENDINDGSQPDNVSSFYNKTEIKNNIEFKQIVEFPSAIGAVSLMPISSNMILVGFIKVDSTGFLSILKIDEGGNISSEIVQSFDVPAPPFAMAPYLENMILVGVGQSLYLLKPNPDNPDQFILSDKKLTTLPTSCAYIITRNQKIWVGDRRESVFYFESLLGVSKNPEEIYMICVDSEPRPLTAMCLINDVTIAVGDKTGQVTLLSLPDDLATQKIWRTTCIADRGISKMTPKFIGQFTKVASYSVSEAITSLMISKYNGSLYYTTLLGQIGAFIPMKSDEEFALLSKAEIITEKMCKGEFGLTLTRRFEPEKICIVSGDVIDLMDQLKPESLAQIEEVTNCHRQAILGLLCRIKTELKF